MGIVWLGETRALKMHISLSTFSKFSRAFFMGASNVFTHEAARATTAAPTYYQPVAVGGQRMVSSRNKIMHNFWRPCRFAIMMYIPNFICQADGAIIANNPVLIALCEAELLWPGVPIGVVLSLGTGTQVGDLV